ncbi:hypothetical protein PYH59_09960 [Mammaliicoccus lentus]|uniref:hypothetical protein n=1 Tax=Mammaliicoccus TaxID=2803850 RepID=UPI001187C456|nr:MULTISPECIES: hypothetical protein [Mammaliicoccus]QDR64983.1 hypothetical protein FPV13_08850 [Mammaliicoccus sciuri]UXU79109.1 hypothetical protein MUA27_05720 [Mammaliicoccus sciuri]WHI54160.1 hypothetical protein PYH59_09960 [Mammaliicoccus lentus]
MPKMFILSNGEEVIPHTQRGKDSASLIKKVKKIIQEKGNETTTYTYERLKSGDFPLGEHQITIRWSDE